DCVAHGGCSQHLAPGFGAGTAVYQGFPGTVLCGTKDDKVCVRVKGAPSMTPMAAAAVDPAPGTVCDEADPFRLRLLDGLAASIGARGYRATTVADIVRHARTSKRTFYDQYASKEQCFLELLLADNDKLGESIRAAVDPEAD